jgi:hypothetical protein
MREVTSHSMFEASSTKFHPDGLYSEEIFGELGSQSRMEYYGYINLKTKILHPHVFKTIMTLKNTYEGIISGRTYAVYSEELQDLIPCTKNTPDANTGYNFFLSNLLNLKFNRTSSIKRDKKLQIFEKYTERELFVTKFPVCPAGIRDVQIDEKGVTSSEEINKLYLGLLSLSQALPPQLDEDMILLYDPIRYSIQKKALEIWEYLWNIFTGKSGFAQRRHASRSIAWGARNVISAAKIEAKTPDDHDFLKHDETLLPVYQAMKMFQPMTVQKIRYQYITPLFTVGAQAVPLIDPKTYNVQYIELTEKESAKWNSKEGIEQLITSFEDETMRAMPVTVQGADQKNYYLMLVYDDDDEIYWLRNVNDFKGQFDKINPDKTFDIDRVRALTYIEMFYFAMIDGTFDKHTLITRYPAVEAGSIYPSKIQIGTTVPSRSVKLVLHLDDNRHTFPLARYPILGKPYLDSTVLHSSKLNALGGDFDGDMVSTNSVITQEANREITTYLKTPASIVHINKKFQSGIANALSKLIFFNLTRTLSTNTVK